MGLDPNQALSTHPHTHTLDIRIKGELETRGEIQVIPLPQTHKGRNQNHKDQHHRHHQSYDDTGEQFLLIGLLALLGALEKREGEEAPQGSLQEEAGTQRTLCEHGAHMEEEEARRLVTV